ncbi:MAG: EF-hand domain-containing protein [Bdellovibrio sp.]|nr:EF-hand domain-containing protein [Methylotenera sp.]
MKFNHTTPFNKAAIVLIGSLSLISLSVPFAMADSKTKEIATEAPADADYKKLDVNSDHKISLKEAVKDKALASSFDATDANKDGSISAEEYAGYKAAIQAKLLDSAATTAAAPTSTPPTAAPVN